jgi:hypothetical protein
MATNANDEQLKPFITAASRHDLMARLARQRHDIVDNAINSAITSQISAPAAGPGAPGGVPKVDGKNGTLDGSTAWGDLATTEDPLSFPFQPDKPPKFPKGKESKEGKESKDSKEDKEGKDSKDGKEDKEGKESKDSKEDKEGKESKDGKEDKDSKEGAKDASDGGKIDADQGTNQFLLYGAPQELSWSTMNQIAKTHPDRIATLLKRAAVI